MRSVRATRSRSRRQPGPFARSRRPACGSTRSRCRVPRCGRAASASYDLGPPRARVRAADRAAARADVQELKSKSRSKSTAPTPTVTVSHPGRDHRRRAAGSARRPRRARSSSGTPRHHHPSAGAAPPHRLRVAAGIVNDRKAEPLVRKRGTTAFMQAGGKIEQGEAHWMPCAANSARRSALELDARPQAEYRQLPRGPRERTGTVISTPKTVQTHRRRGRRDGRDRGDPLGSKTANPPGSGTRATDARHGAAAVGGAAVDAVLRLGAPRGGARRPSIDTSAGPTSTRGPGRRMRVWGRR